MSTRTQSNESTLGPEHIIPDLSLLDTNFITTAVIKFAIGYAFLCVAYLASWHIAVMVALMTGIVWLQYVLLFAVLCAAFVGAVQITPAVTNAVYDAGAYIGSKTKSAFASLRSFASSTKARFAPSSSTVH